MWFVVWAPPPIENPGYAYVDNDHELNIKQYYTYYTQ